VNGPRGRPPRISARPACSTALILASTFATASNGAGKLVRRQFLAGDQVGKPQPVVRRIALERDHRCTSARTNPQLSCVITIDSAAPNRGVSPGRFASRDVSTGDPIFSPQLRVGHRPQSVPCYVPHQKLARQPADHGYPLVPLHDQSYYKRRCTIREDVTHNPSS
jgi:hypothetical protein